MFMVFDRDDSGQMTADELMNALTKLFSWRPTRYEAQKLIEMVDEDGDEQISFSEFVQMFTQGTAPFN